MVEVRCALGTASCRSKRGEGTIIISGPARVWVRAELANHSSLGHLVQKKSFANNWDVAWGGGKVSKDEWLCLAPGTKGE